MRKKRILFCTALLAAATSISAISLPVSAQTRKEITSTDSINSWNMDGPESLFAYKFYLTSDAATQQLILQTWPDIAERAVRYSNSLTYETCSQDILNLLSWLAQYDGRINVPTAPPPPPVVEEVPTPAPPDTPEQPETPEPENPDPETPEKPGDDTQNPEKPDDSQKPDGPEKPGESDKPENPGDSEKPDNPNDPEKPDGSEKPENPSNPENPDNPDDDDKKDETDDNKKPEDEGNKPGTSEEEGGVKPEGENKPVVSDKTEEDQIKDIEDKKTDGEIDQITPASQENAEYVPLTFGGFSYRSKNRKIKATEIGGWYNSEPDFNNASAWKGSSSAYNTPGLWGQCTWFAWARFYEIYGFNPGFTGNGNVCVNQLLGTHPDKFERATKPKAGSVFSSDMAHNHVGIVLDVNPITGMLLIQEGNLDGVSNPNWNVAIQDYRTVELSLNDLRALYGNVVFANPIEGRVKAVSQAAKPKLNESTIDEIQEKIADIVPEDEPEEMVEEPVDEADKEINDETNNENVIEKDSENDDQTIVEAEDKEAIDKEAVDKEMNTENSEAEDQENKDDSKTDQDKDESESSSESVKEDSEDLKEDKDKTKENGEDTDKEDADQDDPDKEDSDHGDASEDQDHDDTSSKAENKTSSDRETRKKDSRSSARKSSARNSKLFLKTDQVQIPDHRSLLRR
ncbi:CHAP domain-containing protein [Ileibacterium valens]|uniref:CHAP domain-containing protein n=1 Tax=Ileibacterium valens TaxID=1862668 RepID=UPI003518BC2A